MVPAAYSPDTGLFYVPTNHVCMNYEPYKVGYTAGQPYVGATVSMFPPAGEHNMGNFIAWDAKTGKIVWSDKEQFSVWSGALATAGNVVFYGTLEGYLKAVDAKTGKELYKFKTPSGIIGNVITYEHGGKRYGNRWSRAPLDRLGCNCMCCMMLSNGRSSGCRYNSGDD